MGEKLAFPGQPRKPDLIEKTVRQAGLVAFQHADWHCGR
jgi:hypothetical protein